MGDAEVTNDWCIFAKLDNYAVILYSLIIMQGHVLLLEFVCNYHSELNFKDS